MVAQHRVLNATELYILRWLKGEFYAVCILPEFLKKDIMRRSVSK